MPTFGAISLILPAATGAWALRQKGGFYRRIHRHIHRHGRLARLPGYENRDRRRNRILFRKISLIDRDAHPAARVNINKRLADRDAHERLHVRKRILFPGQFESDLIAQFVAEVFEIARPEYR